uniref:Transmembrane protein n=1 Tax=Ralstonia solanacearum CFBP2957 TaxID=859656 RepID=D8P682_RALSL|nr:protein of unknown function [Ralstonia solanacearum CFBP2957]
MTPHTPFRGGVMATTFKVLRTLAATLFVTAFGMWLLPGS